MRARLQIVGVMWAMLGAAAGGIAAAEGPAGALAAIDVSHHSGAVDWQQVVEQGFGLVYLKATEGVDSADPMFEEHWRALGELGVARGAYHYFVTENDPESTSRPCLPAGAPG